jgi:glycosyltransferase involved in cell wall biosynthesis
VELIFVEGHSKDETLKECLRVAAGTPEKDIKVLTQEGKGKGDAVRLGFSQASGDILMILDADLSVAPEDLPAFYRALVSGKGEFVNGSKAGLCQGSQGDAVSQSGGQQVFCFLAELRLGTTR